MLFLVLGVWVSHQFPSLTNGPKTSVELLQGLFRAPVEIRTDAAKYVLNRVKKDAIVQFVDLLDAPEDARGRVRQWVLGERFDEVSAPFVHYLYELYGAPALAAGEATADLQYAEKAEDREGDGPGVGTLLAHPLAVRRHAGNALRLFDALFLQTRPGVDRDLPLPERYDPAAYTDIKAVVRELAGEFLGPPSDARDEARNEYLVMFEETLRDDKKLTELIEFFTDLVRDLADSWLQSFVQREKRKESRLKWVEEKLLQNRYYEIADYAQAQSVRRLAIHLVVDGLQGKLLEGLAQLSSGERDRPGARYVIDLVRQHQTREMDPGNYESKMPPGLGAAIGELSEKALRKPEYLENFKKYFFDPSADAVIVNVATVDTPSISVATVSGTGKTYADRALFGVVSDHGLVYTPQVVSTDDLLFEAMRRDGIDIKCLKLTHDEGGMPAIHGSQHVKPTRPFDAVVGSTAGGSYIIDLFSTTASEGDDEAWRRHPDYHELRHYKLLSGQTIDWIDQLKTRLAETMDLAVVREQGPEPGKSWPREFESVVRIITPRRGEARISRELNPGSQTSPDEPRRFYSYEVLGERDPLDLAAAVRDYLIAPGRQTVEAVQRSFPGGSRLVARCSDAQWQELLSCTLRPDVIHQLSHLYDSDRAGTINVFPAAHVGMNSGVPGRHAGEAFGEKNGTQIYRGAGLKRAVIQTARNGSMPVTIYHWLAGDAVFQQPDPQLGSRPADQFGYHSLLDDPAFASIR